MTLTIVLLAALLSWATAEKPKNWCDLDGDGKLTAADVDMAIKASLQSLPCNKEKLWGEICNVVVIQRVINAVNGDRCRPGVFVTVTWKSVRPIPVNVYRGVGSGLEKLTKVPISTNWFIDELPPDTPIPRYTVRGVVTGKEEQIDLPVKIQEVLK